VLFDGVGLTERRGITHSPTIHDCRQRVFLLSFPSTCNMKAYKLTDFFTLLSFYVTSAPYYFLPVTAHRKNSLPFRRWTEPS
jgi:hypothetical protein